MKKYIFLLFIACFTLNSVAQDLEIKAMVLYKNDGSQDTILWKNAWGYSYQTTFYGKENPKDDDYVRLKFTLTEDYQMDYSCLLTKDGEKAPYQYYGTMLSSNHIDTAPDLTYCWWGYIYYVYYVDDGQWYYPDNSGKTNPTYYFSPDRVKKSFSIIPGQTFYVRAFYILDDNVYYSSEISVRAPKTLNIMHELVYDDYYAVNDSILFKINAVEIIKDNIELFADTSVYKQQILGDYVKNVLLSKSMTEIMSMAFKKERCDDGTLYLIDNIPSAITDEALMIMRDETTQPFYVQATLDNIFVGTTGVNDFGTSKCFPTIYVVDEKWGIRDNQYLATPPDGTTARPRLAFLLNRLMQPGKKYDIILTFAPNIQNELDRLNTYFYVCISDQNDDGSMPKLKDSQSFGNDTIVSDTRGLFIAQPHELKVMTMQYTPINFTHLHVLQLCHIFSFTSSANRRKYGQQFRVVGIEVKPHESQDSD